MDAATTARLVAGAQRLGVALDALQIEKLARYLALLLRWNEKINLTAITDPRSIIELHFLDSLAAAPLMRDCRTLIDVGAGAGFPGAVLAIALPALSVECIDAVAKKVAFLQTLRRELIPNLTARHARDEAIFTTFDAAISRATWEPALWLAHGARLVREGGLLAAMLTAGAPSLPPPPGFEACSVVEYEVGGARRRIESFRRS